MILGRDDERLWTKIDVKGKDECWKFLGSLAHRFGYGYLRYNGKHEGAHRAAWMSWNSSPVPEGMWVLHSCDNPACCNPHHLRVGTAKDNLADAVSRKRLWMQQVTHCPQGHEYTEENTFYSHVNKRGCRECRKAAHAKRYANPEYAAAKRKQAREKYALENPNRKPRRSKYDKAMASA